MIAGPDTVFLGQSVTYTITVNGSSGTKGGVDIAAWQGVLAPVSSTLKISAGDVVHRQRVSVPSSYEVAYTAPSVSGKDTLYAIGKDTVFDGWNWAPKKIVTVVPLTSVDEESVPEVFELGQNYPNPFNPVTTIEYSLPNEGKVVMTVYDILGYETFTLVNAVQQAGMHRIIVNGENLASGIYFYRLQAGEYIQTKRFTLLR